MNAIRFLALSVCALLSGVANAATTPTYQTDKWGTPTALSRTSAGNQNDPIYNTNTGTGGFTRADQGMPGDGQRPWVFTSTGAGQGINGFLTSHQGNRHADSAQSWWVSNTGTGSANYMRANQGDAGPGQNPWPFTSTGNGYLNANQGNGSTSPWVMSITLPNGMVMAIFSRTGMGDVVAGNDPLMVTISRTGSWTKVDVTNPISQGDVNNAGTPANMSVTTTGNGYNVTMVREEPAILTKTSTGAANGAITLRLAAVTGKYHYITSIRVWAYLTGTIATSGVPLMVTTVNLNSRSWPFRNIGVADDLLVLPFDLTKSIRSAATGTDTDIVCPAVANLRWFVEVSYYAAQ